MAWRTFMIVTMLGTAALTVGCKTEHTVTLDHRISGSLDVNLKVDRELDRFFDFEDDMPPATQPAPSTGTTPPEDEVTR